LVIVASPLIVCDEYADPSLIRIWAFEPADRVMFGVPPPEEARGAEAVTLETPPPPLPA
jgi:hypothetical protein